VCPAVVADDSRGAPERSPEFHFTVAVDSTFARGCSSPESREPQPCSSRSSRPRSPRQPVSTAAAATALANRRRMSPEAYVSAALDSAAPIAGRRFRVAPVRRPAAPASARAKAPASAARAPASPGARARTAAKRSPLTPAATRSSTQVRIATTAIGNPTTAATPPAAPSAWAAAARGSASPPPSPEPSRSTSAASVRPGERATDARSAPAASIPTVPRPPTPVGSHAARRRMVAIASA